MKINNPLELVCDNTNIDILLDTIPACPERFLHVQFRTTVQNSNSPSKERKCLPFCRSNLIQAPIISAQVLIDGQDVKKVIEIVFNSSELNSEFLPGDTIGILPKNSDSDVEFLLESLKICENADHPCTVNILAGSKKKNARTPTFLPSSMSTAREILKEYLDIHRIPKKLLLRALIEYTTDEQEIKFLKILCSKEHGSSYTKHILEDKISFIDILRVCNTCKPPLSLLLEHLPQLLPRPYSITNSPHQRPNEIRIVFSVLNDRRKGLTTGILEEILTNFQENKNDQPIAAPIYLRDSTNFRITEEKLEKNLIMIGIGCAVAPFLGFLEHKAAQADNRFVRKCWMFTGARYEESSVFSREFKMFKTTGILDELFEAYSRQPESVTYVQQHIVANKERFIEMLLKEETLLFVCADGADISKDIAKCIKNCIKDVLQIDDDETDLICTNLKTSRKYIEDVWT